VNPGQSLDLNMKMREAEVLMGASSKVQSMGQSGDL